MSESRGPGTSLCCRPQKNLEQGYPVYRDRSKGAFSLLLSLEHAKKVKYIIFHIPTFHRDAQSFSGRPATGFGLKNIITREEGADRAENIFQARIGGRS